LFKIFLSAAGLHTVGPGTCSLWQPHLYRFWWYYHQIFFVSNMEGRDKLRDETIF